MRLIDADELVEKFLKWLPFKEDGEEKYYGIPIQENIAVSAMMEIEEAETVDAVEVVRCKDCKHCYYDQIYFHYWCERTTGNIQVNENDFCSYGKRKEESVCQTE